MKIYIVNTQYVEYLRKYEPTRVMVNEVEDGGIRKYVGIVFNINSINYFVPLSSPKESDYKIINGKKVIRKSIVPIHRIIIGKGKKINFLGKFLFSNMIPVPDSELKLLDLKSITNIKYKNILYEQIIYIRKNKIMLQKDHAEVIYNQKTNNYPNIGYLSSTADFILLEQKMSEYITLKQITISEEQVALTKHID